MRRILLPAGSALVFAALLSVTACSSDDDGGVDEDQAQQNAENGLPEDCVTRLEVVNVADDSVEEGSFGSELVLAAGSGTQFEFAVLGYEAGTVAMPVDAEVPAGKNFFAFTISNPDEPVAAGQSFTNADEPGRATGEVVAAVFARGASGVDPGIMTVTITAVTPSRVCGSIEPTNGEFGVSGTFKAQRVNVGSPS